MPISDKEQIQMMKNWWKQYGGYILFVVVVFVVVNVSWRYWQQYKHQRLEHTSMTYMQMLIAFEQQKNDEVNVYAKHLIQDYAGSPYASLAALMLAKIAIQNGDLQQAKEKLQFVIKKSSDKSLRQIARIRAARILLTTKQPQEALNLLKVVDDPGYIAEISEINGDAWLALGKLVEAKKAYQKAKDLIVGGAKSPLLQMKMQQF